MNTREEDLDFQSPLFLEKCYDRLAEIESDLSFSDSALYDLNLHHSGRDHLDLPVSSESF